MTLGDIIRRSGRSLKSAKIRTILTSLAIAVGGFTLTLTLAASNGARHYADQLIKTNFDQAELIVGRDKEVSNNGAPSDKPKEYDESITSLQTGGAGSSLQIKRVTQQDVTELRAIPGIEQVRENYQISIRYVTRAGYKKYTGSAMVYNQAQKPELKSGSLPKTGDIAVGSVLLPDGYLDILGFKSPEAAIGQKISVTVGRPFSIADVQTIISGIQSGNLNATSAASAASSEKSETFTIAGITKKPATSLDFGAAPLRLSSTDSKRLYDFTTDGTPDHEKYIYVFARVSGGEDITKLESVKKSLESKGYYVQSVKDVQKAITQFINILQIIVTVFGLITLVASVFGIVNTQYISVLERTREIGLMKALGMRRRDVSRLFMIEATWIGFLGGAIGSLAGFILGILLNPWITQKLDLGAGNNLLIFQPLQAVLLIAMLMLVATVAGWLPARKAAKLDPIEALRTE